MVKRLACVLGVPLAAGPGAARLGAAEADAGAKAGKVYFDSIKGGNCMKQPMTDEETRNLIDFLSTLKEE